MVPRWDEMDGIRGITAVDIPKDTFEIREVEIQKMLQNLWQDPKTKMQFDKQEINPMESYGIQKYLGKDISMFKRHLITSVALITSLVARQSSPFLLGKG